MGIALVFPSNGIRLNEELTIDLPNIKSYFILDTAKNIDYTSILEANFDIDSVKNVKSKVDEISDSILQARMRDSIRSWQLKLHYPENKKSPLLNIFNALQNKTETGLVRIMHYGDSQIEGDRITGYLRYKLQSKFGGHGPGLIPAVPLVRPTSIVVEQSENWNRYTMYGPVDSTVNHTKYGILATYGRFTELILDKNQLKDGIIDSLQNELNDNFIIEEDSIIQNKKTSEFSKTEKNTDSTATEKAWIKFEKSNLTYKTTPEFNSIKVLFGNLTKPLTVRAMFQDTIEVKKREYQPGNTLEVFSVTFKNYITELTVEFETKESPDVYGISLDSKTGVSIDNIAMRGSSGTLFKKIDRELFTQSLKLYKPELLILQYGGNVMPYMDTQKKAVTYGRWFKAQLVLLKSILPKTSIIVIGPSDMGKFENGEYKPYELLSNVRDELKKVTLEEGGVYWDLLEAMGGIGSMKAWVESNPPLAGKDYVHFNRKGAVKISQMFYNALIEEYNKYENN